MKESDDGDELVLETGSRAAATKLEASIFDRFEDPECLVEIEDQAEWDGVVVGRLHSSEATNEV